jgi:hypothetical protein
VMFYWFVALVLEEIRQLAENGFWSWDEVDKNTLLWTPNSWWWPKDKPFPAMFWNWELGFNTFQLKTYVTNAWNIADIINYVLYFVTFAIRKVIFTVISCSLSLQFNSFRFNSFF